MSGPTRAKVKRECKDCQTQGITTKRSAPHVGPRCYSHHREFSKATKARAHDLMVQRTYGLEPGDYERLYTSQNGRCAVLGCRATGKSKRLAVDHNHKTGEVRGLLCGVHNQLLGYNGDNPDTFRSMAEYLESPPARRVLDQAKHVQVSSGDDE